MYIFVDTFKSANFGLQVSKLTSKLPHPPHWKSLKKKTSPPKFALHAKGLLHGVKNGNAAGMKYSIAAKGARKKRNN